MGPLYRIRHLVIMCVALFCYSNAHAWLVKKIIIEGNSRTQERAILREARIHEGDDVDSRILEAAKDRLALKTQFVLKSFSFDEQKQTIHIAIEEKWSLIPIPMFSQSGDSYSRGFIIYENNFLGRMETFIPALAWTNAGPNGALIYQSESLFSPDAGISASIIKKNDQSFFERENHPIHMFESRVTMMEMLPNWLYRGHMVKLGPFYVERRVYDEKGQRTFGVSGAGGHFRYHWDKQTPLEIGAEGPYITYNLFYFPDYQGKPFVLHDTEARQSWGVFEDDIVDLIGLFRWANDKSYFYPELLGGSEGLRGYDAMSVAAYRYTALSLQYQHKLWGHLFATVFSELSSIHLIEPVYHNPHAGFEDKTIGGGFRYYFKKISIPGVIVEYGRNIDDHSDHFHFNLGIRL